MPQSNLLDDPEYKKTIVRIFKIQHKSATIFHGILKMMRSPTLIKIKVWYRFIQGTIFTRSAETVHLLSLCYIRFPISADEKMVARNRLLVLFNKCSFNKILIDSNFLRWGDVVIFDIFSFFTLSITSIARIPFFTSFGIFPFLGMWWNAFHQK